jgi:hypothetical protein
MNDLNNDLSITEEERIRAHYVGRVRSLKAPPMSYRVGVQGFDGIARRLQARIELGERLPDMTRAEFITLHFAHGAVRVYLGRDIAENKIGFTEFTGEDVA